MFVIESVINGFECLRRHSSSFVFVSIVPVMLAACFEDEVPARRGPFAFHYAPILTENELAWYSQFDLLVTHDPLPRDQVERLHAAGTRLLLYEWSVAFYDSRASDWQRSLLSHRSETLLNAVPLTGGSGSETSGAWYYDPLSREHEIGRATEIQRHLEVSGYDGIFLDATTMASVHPDAKLEYERRHPDTPYDLAFSRFLAQLRRTLPKAVLFTNQGYRSPQHYLPYVDWDLTESLITWPNKDGSFRLRPWNDPSDPWNSIHVLMRKLIAPIAARYPSVRFGHLNYIDAASPETIRLVAGVAQLFGGEGFVAAPALSDEVDPIHFRSPGKPTSDRIDLADGRGAYRVFEHGVIVVAAAVDEITIDNPQRKKLRNRFTRELICGDGITIPPTAGEPRAWFFDKTSDCDSRR